MANGCISGASTKRRLRLEHIAACSSRERRAAGFPRRHKVGINGPLTRNGWMTRTKKLLLGAAGAAALTAALAAVRNMRAAPFPGAVPPPPPTRPPQRPTVDEAPRPASEPARPQVSDRGSPESEPQPPEQPTDVAKKPENPTSGSEVSDASSETNYLEMSREQLYAEARRRNLRGRSSMTREQLARALAES